MITITQEFTNDLANSSSQEYKEFEENFTQMMKKVYHNVPGFLGVKIKTISKGSIVVNHDVQVEIKNTDTATEQYDTVLHELDFALAEAANCDNSNPDLNCTKLDIDTSLTKVEQEKFDPEALCKAAAPVGFSQFYTYQNSSASGIVCVSVCDSRHQNQYSCQPGQCILASSGPICFCPISDSHWFLGSHCQNKISKAGFYAGVSLTAIVLLAAVMGLLVYQFRTKRLTQQRERDSKEDLVSQWFENDFKWPDPDRGAFSHPRTFNQRGYGHFGAQGWSPYERSVFPSLGSVNAQIEMKIERPQIKPFEI
ncbi:mucin-3A [Polyodon spathula]|uniref:mucin-3A n=1 Tax=Polyodon spathula TaxID=7913 RepID=UPI001B7F6F25|nr:mucin-3A [Polyodon spathula]